MRVAIIENTRYTHHGQVGVALHEAAAMIDLYKPWRGEALPKRVDADALIIFGGEQAATDDDQHPYLPALTELIRDYDRADRPVLGICLGSQLMARAFGGENQIGTVGEFGWCEVSLTAEGQRDPVLSGLPKIFPILQWHSDTFTLPPGAVHLAHSAGAINQSFRMGRASYATQFHFEANRAVAADWNKSFPDLLERCRPGWANEFHAEAEKHSAAADAHGLQIARAWLRLIR